MTRFEKESDFLEAAASSKRLVAHFAHADFDSCKLVDAHLERLAPKWLGTRFARIEASDAPFFVTRLKVKVLPAVLCFVDGACTGRVVGFDELGGTKDFTTRGFEKALAARSVLVERFVPGGGGAGGGGGGGATGTREARDAEEEENRRPEDEDGCVGGGRGGRGGKERLAPPEHSRRNVRAGGASRRRGGRGGGGDSEDESGSDDSRSDSETESM